MPNIVYVFTNPSMPGLCKIGMTNGESIQARLQQLNTTGVPLPFECHFAAEVDSCQRVERILHALFSEHRVNPRREFFQISPEKAVLALSLGSFKDITPGNGGAQGTVEEIRALGKEKARRERFSFDKADIPLHAELQFTRDENITAQVAENNKVLFQNEYISLSEAAQRAMAQSKGASSSQYSLQGPAYWMYQDETLDERRIRLENETAEFLDEKS